MGTEKNRVTIADVAEAAGVSKTTISRYLNGKFEFMSEESKEKIAAVISRLHYRPNNLARGLKSSKSKLIGVVIADIANPFSSILLKGIGDCCKQYGYNVMSAFTDNDPEREKECILSLVDQQVEGLIINTTCQNNEFLEQIAEKYVPIVLADRPIFPTRFDTVRTNDYPVTLETLHYLAQQGYRRVGFFSEPVQGIGTRVLRLSAYHEACRTGVIEEPQEYILPQEDNPQADIELVQSFMARNTAAKKAIFTANGVAMLRVLEAIETLNLTMPDDLGCCGFDNWRWTGLIKPGITAISQPSYEVGVECVKRMMMRIQGSKAAPQMIELVNELVIRGSV